MAEQKPKKTITQSRSEYVKSLAIAVLVTGIAMFIMGVQYQKSVVAEKTSAVNAAAVQKPAK